MSLRRRQSLTWRAVVFGILAYEAVAMVSAGRVSYITEVVRRLPAPARLAASVAVGAALLDHFSPRGRIF